MHDFLQQWDRLPGAQIRSSLGTLARIVVQKWLRGKGFLFSVLSWGTSRGLQSTHVNPLQRLSAAEKGPTPNYQTLSLQPHTQNPASIRECIHVKQTEWGTGQHTETVCLFLRHFLTDGLTTTPALERVMLPWVVCCNSRFFPETDKQPWENCSNICPPFQKGLKHTISCTH